MLVIRNVYLGFMMITMTAYSGLSWGSIKTDKITLNMTGEQFFYANNSRDNYNDSNDFSSEKSAPLLSGPDSPQQLAEKYRLKALEAFTQANFHQSLDDLNKAIAIDKNNALLYETRAVVYEYLGENERAMADIHLALTLDSADFHPYMTRANIYYYQGEYKKALQDYETFLTVYNDNLYRMLWYYQAAFFLKHESVHDNGDNRADEKLKRYISDTDISIWPGPIAQLYLKQLTPESLLALLADSNVTEPGVLCEAYFYLGQYYLMNNKQDAAASYFRLARKTNAQAYIEYLYAGKELLRLKNKVSKAADR